jgi:ABC-2 type transport system permease protein
VMQLFFLSGALFPLTNLPKVLAFIVSIDPLSYGVDGLHATLLNQSHFGLPMDLSFLAIATVVMLFVGSWLFSRIQV